MGCPPGFAVKPTSRLERPACSLVKKVVRTPMLAGREGGVLKVKWGRCCCRPSSDMFCDCGLPVSEIRPNNKKASVPNTVDGRNPFRTTQETLE